VGTLKSIYTRGDPVFDWLEQYVPDALPPVLAAWALFLIPLPAAAARSQTARTVLDRHDFQTLDWDTLFLIAGGLCLGATLDASGAAMALARTVAAADLSPLVLMLALGAVSVLLSELTSNTTTATLMVPIARALAGALPALDRRLCPLAGLKG
jgi:di/tricarboxylate transporter